MKAIVLANGVFPKRDEALRAMQQVPVLVCCDGAYNKLVASGVFSHSAQLPDIHVVGDGDSLTEEMRRSAPLPAKFVDGFTEQETNDLTKSVEYAISIGVERVLILGATGLREDHTLGNISLLAQYMSMRTLSGKPLQVRIYSDYGYFTPIKGTAELESFKGQQVSLFSLDQQAAVSTEGLKYPIQERCLRYWWEATLNEALGEKFKITLPPDAEMIVYQTHR